MALIESLFEMINSIETEGEMVQGYTMEPIKGGYNLMHEKQKVCCVSFINNGNNEDYDMETACADTKNYKVMIKEVVNHNKVKSYIKKLNKLGFEEITKE